MWNSWVAEMCKWNPIWIFFEKFDDSLSPELSEPSPANESLVIKRVNSI